MTMSDERDTMMGAGDVMRINKGEIKSIMEANTLENNFSKSR
jgi:hypothetical protein